MYNWKHRPGGVGRKIRNGNIEKSVLRHLVLYQTCKAAGRKIESAFGKYKNYIHSNPMVGIKPFIKLGSLYR